MCTDFSGLSEPLHSLVATPPEMDESHDLMASHSSDGKRKSM